MWNLRGLRRWCGTAHGSFTPLHCRSLSVYLTCCLRRNFDRFFRCEFRGFVLRTGHFDRFASCPYSGEETGNFGPNRYYGIPVNAFCLWPEAFRRTGTCIWSSKRPKVAMLCRQLWMSRWILWLRPFLWGMCRRHTCRNTSEPHSSSYGTPPNAWWMLLRELKVCHTISC